MSTDFRLTFSSELYTIEQLPDYAKTMLQAFGTIDGHRHQIRQFCETKECKPGTVPDWFKEHAQLTFERREARLDAE